MDLPTLVQAQLYAPAFVFRSMLEGMGRMIDQAPRRTPRATPPARTAVFGSGSIPMPAIDPLSAERMAEAA